MGFAIAEQLATIGAKVILICGPVHLKTNHPSILRVDVTSADEMYAACLQYFDSCDGAIMTAAVADYAPVKIEKEKIKRSQGNLILELRPNKDIAAELGKLKKPHQLLVGGNGFEEPASASRDAGRHAAWHAHPQAGAAIAARCRDRHGFLGDSTQPGVYQ